MGRQRDRQMGRQTVDRWWRDKWADRQTDRKVVSLWGWSDGWAGKSACCGNLTIWVPFPDSQPTPKNCLWPLHKCPGTFTSVFTQHAHTPLIIKEKPHLLWEETFRPKLRADTDNDELERKINRWTGTEKTWTYFKNYLLKKIKELFPLKNALVCFSLL